MPSGVSKARSSAKAISWIVFFLSGEPLTRYSAPSTSMSSGLASSMWAAYRRALGVRVLDDDVVHRDAQLVADDLRVGGLVALAMALGAHRDHDLAGQVD